MEGTPRSIAGNIVDVHRREIYRGTVHFDAKICSVDREGPAAAGVPYVIPPLVDAHIHVESSMLAPAEFARLAMVHGTVGSVSDPHEIGNVLGVEGVEFMLDDAKGSPFKFMFGAPSCVPATEFETAGARISAREVGELLARPEIGYLSEVMNFPGVMNGDAEVLAKIAAAQRQGKPVDGHAPGLRGEDARRYFAAGISTDHECFTADEALDKLRLGVKVQIRDGSAARNFEALQRLIAGHAGAMMFCSDDKHPNELEEGHVNALVARAVAAGHELFDVLRVASVNPVEHYGMGVGLLRAGDAADFAVVEDLRDFRVTQTWIDGALVARDGRALSGHRASRTPNRFSARPVSAAAFAVKASGGRARVIECTDGQLMTGCAMEQVGMHEGYATADVSRDILKIAVINRYSDAPPAVGFIRNFGLRQGALASSVAHDSHNVVAVGTNDDDLAAAVNLVIEARGGLSAAGTGRREVLPLAVAGLMSDGDGYEVARRYKLLDALAKAWGSKLRAPYMTLSFMALLVIPSLKLSDKGLFDGGRFCFTPLFE